MPTHSQFISLNHDALAHDYDEYRDFETISGDVYAVFAEIVCGILGSSKVILDLGAGPGKYTVALAERCCQVTAVDISPAMLTVLRSCLRGSASSRVKTVEDDAHQLELPDSQFDSVIAILLFQHLSQPEKAVAEIKRVLRPEGFLATWFYSGNSVGAHERNPVHEHLERIYMDELRKSRACPKVNGWGGKRANEELARRFHALIADISAIST